jgi:hypothetical protein
MVKTERDQDKVASECKRVIFCVELRGKEHFGPPLLISNMVDISRQLDDTIDCLKSALQWFVFP